MVYAGKPLSEIAGYDSWQLKYLIFRKRDKRGRLIRKSPKLPSWVEIDSRGQRVISNEIPFSVAVKRAHRQIGTDDKTIEKMWGSFLAENPKFGKVGVDG